MTKYILVFLAVFGLGYFTHSHFIKTDTLFTQLLLKTYIFHFVFSTSICIAFHILRKKLSEQLGYVYLFSVVVKIIIFFSFFYNSVWQVNLPTNQRVSLLIPMVLFLFFEAYFITKIMTKIKHE